MNTNQKIAFVTIIVVFIIAAIVYYVYETNYGKTFSSTVMSPTPSILTPSSSDSSLTNLYTDVKGIYSIRYPNDFQLDTQSDNNAIRLTKIGETQQGETELYDGIVIQIETSELNGRILSDWVDEAIANATKDGVTTLIDPKNPVSINGYQGFTYTIEGLGTFNHRIIQKDETSNYAVTIVTTVNDPEDNGYEFEVDSILLSLNILK
jgi:hypothetical protein